MAFRNEEMFRSNGVNIIAGTGAGLLFFGLASIYAAFDNTLTFLAVGALSLAFGFGFLGWGLGLNMKHFGRIIPRRDQVLTFQPVRNDNFTIVIDGLGSFGNRENPAGSDMIARQTVNQLIERGAMIRTARFYSRNGSDNLLSDFENERERGEG